ncbi:hypothetical protein [Pedobacter sp. WC2423]|uniref:hypothetical protein n=1 Tax=Pedobacter sp. WC2423 TaxID=3234142 RepID=UPI003467CF3C
MKDKLINDIYNYYPIGSSIKRAEYSGYSELMNRLEKKNDVYNLNNNNGGTFEIGEFLSANQIEYIPDFQNFPSYGVSIFLGESEQNNTKISGQLILRISMLTNSFTVFYIEVISSNNYHETLSFKNLQLSKNNFYLDPGARILNLVKTAVNQSNSDLIFADPILLFTNKIGKGVPHGLDDVPEALNYYSIYDYLYGSDFSSYSTLISDFFVAPTTLTIVPY